MESDNTASSLDEPVIKRRRRLRKLSPSTNSPQSLNESRNSVSPTSSYVSSEGLQDECIEDCANDDVDMLYEDGSTPLHSAVYMRRYERLTELCELGADVNAQDHEGLTPLHWAMVGDSSCECVEKLIDFGADINITDLEGLTPLHYGIQNAVKDHVHMSPASDWDESEVADDPDVCVHINLLLQNGAKARTRDNNGDTPLHQAVLSLSCKQISKLIEAGADVNAKNQDGVTPFHLLFLRNDVKPVLELFLRLSNNLNATDKEGDTPMHVCVQQRKSEFIETLVRHGADINARRKYDENTPLHMTVLDLSYVCAEELIRCGADINSRNQEGCTALILAVKNSCRSIVELLLLSGDCVDTPDYHGDTPLHHCLRLGEYQHLETLIDFGADVDTINDKGKTPLDLELGHKSRRETTSHFVITQLRNNQTSVYI